MKHYLKRKRDRRDYYRRLPQKMIRGANIDYTEIDHQPIWDPGGPMFGRPEFQRSTLEMWPLPEPIRWGDTPA